VCLLRTLLSCSDISGKVIILSSWCLNLYHVNAEVTGAKNIYIYIYIYMYKRKLYCTDVCVQSAVTIASIPVHHVSLDSTCAGKLLRRFESQYIVKVLFCLRSVVQYIGLN
jgi:hypothetical protein